MEILRKIFLILFVFPNLSFITKNVYGESNQLFFTGSTLYNFCRDKSIAHQSACEGYILSVNDNMFSNDYKNEYKICYPKGVSPAQLRLQLIKFIENNPDYMNEPANTIVIKSLLNKYKCKE